MCHDRRQNLPASVLETALLRSHIHMTLEHIQGRWLHHLPGQPVPLPHRSYWEEILPNIQPEPHLMQLNTITSCPITVTWEKRPTPTSLQPPFKSAVLVSEHQTTTRCVSCTLGCPPAGYLSVNYSFFVPPKGFFFAFLSCINRDVNCSFMR